MTRFDDSELDLGPDATPEERWALAELADRLERDRPVIASGFRGELRRGLLRRAGARPRRPERLKAMVFAYAVSGATMLAVAALGVGGIGPLAAG